MLSRLRPRLAGWLRRLVLPFRRRIEPGRYEAGSAATRRGRLLTAPLASPEREYLVYVPRGWSRRRRASLVVLCHGCRQTPEDFAALTRIAEHADREGWLVLLPRQTPRANAFECWNWFDPNTSAGEGECAIVAAQIVDVRRRYRARRERVVIAGLSSGGALAAAMGLRHPRLVRGVFVHSGLACGAASTPASALVAMQHGPGGDVAGIGELARAAQRADPPLPVSLLVVHGDRDDVVAPVNGLALVRQYLRFNAHPAGAAGDPSRAGLPPGDASTFEDSRDRYPRRSEAWNGDAAAAVRHVTVEGLGHAWSGGDGRYACADPRGPDATDLFARFARGAAH